MKKLSEQLLEMSQRTAEVENRTAANQREDQEEFNRFVAEARTRAEAAQSAFATKLDSVEETWTANWRELNEGFAKQVAAAQKLADERRNAIDLANARRKAEAAETYAEIAVEFAQMAAAEAEKAMIEANQARANVESLARPIA